jgi:glycosyltransferase involved in cell wall biosynthesis
MPEILIDVTRLLGRFMKGRLPTGVDRVSLEYVRHFSGQGRALVRLGRKSVSLSPVASRRLFGELLHTSPGFRLRTVQLVAGACLNPGNWGIQQGAFLFNTGHSGLEQPRYADRLRRLKVKAMILVHDLIPITHPEYCRPGELGRHRARMNTALSTATGIIANSRSTLDELERYANKMGQRVPAAVASPLAPAVLPAPSAVRPFSEPYFVMLSTIEPRKNHWLLLQLWRKMVERYGDRTPRLVLVGQRGWECENVVDLLERCEELRGVVIELPACSDTDLATYLRHSQALLFPSFAEGYGMPLMEALALGVPVIASDLPAFREIAGDVPDYLDPLDGMGWMARIEAYTTTECTERVSQLARMSHFVSPTWQAHFGLVEQLLERLA